MSGERKRRTRALDGGWTWHRAIHDVFGPLRNARVALVCRRVVYGEALEARELRAVPPAAGVKGGGVARPREWWHVAVKTNALGLAATVANAGVEVQLGRRWSLDVPVYYSPYDVGERRRARVLAVQPEARFWFCGGMAGHFVGLHTHVAGFNVALNDEVRWQDPNHALWGMGVSYGYAWLLDARGRWGLEATVGAGFAEYTYDCYRNWRNGPRYDRRSDRYWGVTRAGASVSYRWRMERRK